jgi:hypothetical protein
MDPAAGAIRAPRGYGSKRRAQGQGEHSATSNCSRPRHPWREVSLPISQPMQAVARAVRGLVCGMANRRAVRQRINPRQRHLADADAVGWSAGVPFGAIQWESPPDWNSACMTSFGVRGLFLVFSHTRIGWKLSSILEVDLHRGGSCHKRGNQRASPWNLAFTDWNKDADASIEPSLRGRLHRGRLLPDRRRTSLVVTNGLTNIRRLAGAMFALSGAW